MANEETLRKVSEYMAEVREELAEAASDPAADEYPFSCFAIAAEIGSFFLEDGDPQLIAMRNIEPGNLRPQTLKRTQWGGHVVCVESGIAYDPILPEPVPLEEYPEIAFGAGVKVNQDETYGTKAITDFTRLFRKIGLSNRYHWDQGSQ